MNRAQKLDALADHWSGVYARTREYHALEKAKEYRAAALKAGASRKLRRRLARRGQK